ncbi:MAG: hypothetical protein ACRDSZ_09330, partial [Pseudonocardiaceae bacterium]
MSVISMPLDEFPLKERGGVSASAELVRPVTAQMAWLARSWSAGTGRKPGGGWVPMRRGGFLDRLGPAGRRELG